ncbi:MAG: phospholipase [Chloroflexi bacterium]|nr:phospholipase [Chloroflexota bacterium]
MHHHEPDSFWTREHPEPVVLDIGDDVGALILYTPAALHGREIEVSPLSDTQRRVHTAVLRRSINQRPLYAAVYAELPAGDYRIWGDNPALPDRVSIAAGRVAEVDWR